jgi:hypothetical protein
LTVIVVDIFSQFSGFPAEHVGCNRHMAGCVEVDTDPAGCSDCGWMNFDHLSSLVIQPLYEDLAVRNVFLDLPPFLQGDTILIMNISCGQEPRICKMREGYGCFLAPAISYAITI